MVNLLAREILHSVARPAVDAFARDVEAKLAVRVNFRVLVARQAYPRVHAKWRPIQVVLVVGGVSCKLLWRAVFWCPVANSG